VCLKKWGWRAEHQAQLTQSVEELLRAENGKCEVWASFDAAAETSTGFS